jgi:hypothetical protein
MRQAKRAIAQENFLRGAITDVSPCGREGNLTEEKSHGSQKEQKQESDQKIGEV